MLITKANPPPTPPTPTLNQAWQGPLPTATASTPPASDSVYGGYALVQVPGFQKHFLTRQ